MFYLICLFPVGNSKQRLVFIFICHARIKVYLSKLK